ncbi:Neutral/alkaline non-lysosomal ceramidase, N-terminal [Paenibacillus sp. yr247]|uniref:neutral/alkaline non-lysosomal ceramidase N-terminal domain-containing protein n=1 Tax=Paenibacillus sp. yr247 TaxID=1761880 RepID=UPI00088E6117|nr:neutral/alkaline non-lysosomal ceramidase N-terminal domain-containing protein [Paenibacillus sp. yr247]SDO37887.1 Neutral/alkaline non-lysosomal ceramidase, N-terminal [Paenibacillus sp. yr247]
MSLILGVAKVDITPEKPIPLAGYALRENFVFDAVNHPLYATIYFFQERSENDTTISSSLLVSADLLWWGSDRMQGIYGRLQERWGISPNHVILNATHTHSGPQTSTYFPRIGMVDLDYLDTLEDKLFAGIELAWSTMEPVRVERGLGKCSIGIHRRKWFEGKIMMKPNEEGPVDPEVNVIRFVKSDEITKAILVHYTCHPTTTNDNKVSFEFPGKAMQYVEQSIGNGSVAAFLQGCCGDIRPRLIRDGDFYRGGDYEVCHYGRQLADEVLSVLQTSMQQLAPRSLTGMRMTTLLNLQQLPGRDFLISLSKNDNSARSDWAALLLKEPERMLPYRNLEMTRLDIAEGLSFLSFNGEAVVEYGLMIKAMSGGRILPVPYSNGMIGYLPTRLQVEEGGYESNDFIVGFGLPAPFDAGLEDAIREQLSTLVKVP